MKDSDQKSPNASWTSAEVYFEHNGHSIVVWFSTYSGKEKVYVDDELVSDARSWRLSNKHVISIGASSCEIKVSVKGWKNLFLGIYSVYFYVEGELVDQDELEFMKYLGKGHKKKPFSWKRFVFTLIPFLVAGYFVGYFSARFLIQLFGG